MGKSGELLAGIRFLANSENPAPPPCVQPDMKNSMLDSIRIATPCKASWDGMTGDARKRFCAECKLNVYNLSAMTRREAEELILRTEGRLCVRLYQRKDGTVLTTDCPKGVLGIARMRLPAMVAGLLAAIGALLYGAGQVDTRGFSQVEPIRSIVSWVRNLGAPTTTPLMGAPPPQAFMGKPSATPQRQVLMGEMTAPEK